MTNEFEYDVALSFAREDRATAEQLTKLLRERQVTVFHDEYTPEQAWGNDFVSHVVNLYNRRAACCVLLISAYYPLKKWSEQERLAVQERALRDANEYIILLPLDDTEVAGAADAPGYVDIDHRSVESVVDRLQDKLASMPRSSGPPSESHDLRSGNVPSSRPESDSH